MLRRREPASTQWEFENQPLVVQYEALIARVGHRDAQLWQPPALAMTAQAFLMTIALDGETSPVARVVVAGLGLIVIYLSILVMLSTRWAIVNDLAAIRSLEKQMAMSISVVDLRLRSTTPQGRPKGGLSIRAWIFGLAFFALVNLWLLIFATLDMFGVPCASWLGGVNNCLLGL